jgi:hypothetical protein
VAKKRQRGNGAGTVYARKNKEGKITGYRGSYFTPDGKRRYISARRNTECERKLRDVITDADRGMVQLQRIREGGGLVFSEPKNASRRTIDLPQRALEALRSHRKRQIEGQSLELAQSCRITTSYLRPQRAPLWTLRT